MKKDNTTNRKKEIHEAAQYLFLKNGYEATSMSSIAKQAGGVSKRTPYIYFEDKHDMFSAVVLDVLLELEEALEPVWTKQSSPLDVLSMAVTAYADYAFKNPDKFKLIMTFEKVDFYPGRQQELKAHAKTCQQSNDRMTSNFQHVVQNAINQNQINTTLTAKQYCLLLWSSLAGTLSIALERHNILDEIYHWTQQDMLAHFIENFIIKPNQKPK